MLCRISVVTCSYLKQTWKRSIYIETLMFQCQNCRCIPDYCSQTVPRSLCPCGGTQIPCSRTTAGVQAVITGAIDVQQQQSLMIPQAPAMKYFLIQQPVQSVSAHIPSQLTIENQQQFMQTLSSLQQQILSQQVRIGGIQQPSVPPVYVIRTVEQPAQVLRPVQQISEPMISSQYVSAIQQVPIQQTQLMIVPSVQQVMPQAQQFILPLQVPMMQTVTLQVPGKFDTNLNTNHKLFFLKSYISD